MSSITIDGWKSRYDEDTVVFINENDNNQGCLLNAYECKIDYDVLLDFNSDTIRDILATSRCLQNAGLTDISVSEIGIFSTSYGYRQSYSITGYAYGKKYIISSVEDEDHENTVSIVDLYENKETINAKFSNNNEMIDFIILWIQKNQNAIEEKEIF